MSTRTIALLFRPQHPYLASLQQGIAEHARQQQLDWQFLYEPEFLYQADRLNEWPIAGVVADANDPQLYQGLLQANMPKVAIGSSFENPAQYPDCSYIALDNRSLVEAAFAHLKSKGLEQFACYNLNHDELPLWAGERERSLQAMLASEGYAGEFFYAAKPKPATWNEHLDKLCEWLLQLPKPCGLLAVDFSLARHVVQACQLAKIDIPEQISLVSIGAQHDSEHLDCLDVSAAVIDAKHAGELAGQALAKQLAGEEATHLQIVSKASVEAGHSSQFQAIDDPLVMQAVQFIRQNAHYGIKVIQVLNHLKVSRTNLQQRFMDQLGHSIHQQIHNERLAQTQQMLVETELPVADIAQLNGYPTTAYMYQVFNKHLGMTPVAYRNQAQEGKSRS